LEVENAHLANIPANLVLPFIVGAATIL